MTIPTRMGSDALTRHLTYLETRRLSPETIRQRRQRVRDLFTAVGTDDPARISPAMLETWQQGLARRHSPQTQATYTSHARAFFRWLREHGEADPSLLDALVRPKVPRPLPRPISEGALDLALATADTRMRAFITLSAYAGMRAGEIARLRRSDVLDTADPPVIVVREGKGLRDRVIPAGETVLAALREWGLRPGWVFPGPAGHLNPGTVSNRVSEHLHALGLDATCHAGRHRFLTQLYRATRDIRLVQEVAGHATPSSTAVYTAFASERAVEGVRSLDRT